MIVYECDWCGTQARLRKPDSWEEITIRPCNTDIGNGTDETICTACARALTASIQQQKNKRPGGR